MFGRGTWAIVGLATESLEAFRTSLEDRTVMAAFSQLAGFHCGMFFHTSRARSLVH